MQLEKYQDRFYKSSLYNLLFALLEAACLTSSLNMLKQSYYIENKIYYPKLLHL